MQKYKQLQKLIGKKFHRWFYFEQVENTIEMRMGNTKLVTVRSDDSFTLFDIRRFMDKSNMLIIQQCLPYGLLTEKRIDGTYINNQRWDKNTTHLVFNSQGDCLNPPKKSNHNKENRKTFNKYLLLWEKNTRIAAKMDAPRLGNIPLPAYYSASVAELTAFIQHPACTDIVEHCRHSTYIASNVNTTIDDKTRAIKAFRKHLDKAMYRNFLDGKYPFIGELKNE